MWKGSSDNTPIKYLQGWKAGHSDVICLFPVIGQASEIHEKMSVLIQIECCLCVVFHIVFLYKDQLVAMNEF